MKLDKKQTIELNLRGIVDKTALLEIDNKLYFVQKGDSLATGRITYIYPDCMIIEFEEKKITLKVRNIDYQ